MPPSTHKRPKAASPPSHSLLKFFKPAAPANRIPASTSSLLLETVPSVDDERVFDANHTDRPHRSFRELCMLRSLGMASDTRFLLDALPAAAVRAVVSALSPADVKAVAGVGRHVRGLLNGQFDFQALSVAGHTKVAASVNATKTVELDFAAIVAARGHDVVKALWRLRQPSWALRLGTWGAVTVRGAGLLDTGAGESGGDCISNDCEQQQPAEDLPPDHKLPSVTFGSATAVRLHAGDSGAGAAERRGRDLCGQRQLRQKSRKRAARLLEYWLQRRRFPELTRLALAGGFPMSASLSPIARHWGDRLLSLEFQWCEGSLSLDALAAASLALVRLVRLGLEYACDGPAAAAEGFGDALFRALSGVGPSAGAAASEAAGGGAVGGGSMGPGLGLPSLELLSLAGTLDFGPAVGAWQRLRETPPAPPANRRRQRVRFAGPELLAKVIHFDGAAPVDPTAEPGPEDGGGDDDQDDWAQVPNGGDLKGGRCDNSSGNSDDEDDDMGMGSALVCAVAASAVLRENAKRARSCGVEKEGGEGAPRPGALPRLAVVLVDATAADAAALAGKATDTSRTSVTSHAVLPLGPAVRRYLLATCDPGTAAAEASALARGEPLGPSLVLVAKSYGQVPK